MNSGPRGAAKWLLFLAAGILAVGSSVHCIAYTKAAAVTEHSSLPPFYQAAFKGLWLSDAFSSLLVAVALACIAVRPKLAGKPLLFLLALMPLAMAIILYSTLGNFFAGYLNLIAAISAMIALALKPAAVELPRSPIWS